MASSAVQQKSPERVSWRKKRRSVLMNTAFVIFCTGFPCAYYGGVRDQQGLIIASFVLLFLACGVALVAEK